MNNPVRKYFEHPGKSIRFIEYKALQISLFNQVPPLGLFHYQSRTSSGMQWSGIKPVTQF